MTEEVRQGEEDVVGELVIKETGLGGEVLEEVEETSEGKDESIMIGLRGKRTESGLTELDAGRSKLEVAMSVDVLRGRPDKRAGRQADRLKDVGTR